MSKVVNLKFFQKVAKIVVLGGVNFGTQQWVSFFCQSLKKSESENHLEGEFYPERELSFKLIDTEEVC